MDKHLATTQSRIAKRWGMEKRSGYAGASINPSNISWITGAFSADAEIRYSLQKLRDRCRDLERNNPYMRKFLQELEVNVIGSEGVTLQMKIKEPDKTVGGQLEQGKPDVYANNAVENQWFEWKKKKNCSVSKTINFHNLEKLVIRSVARDGEAFIRMVRGFDNPYKFAIQLIEPDQIDHNYSKTLTFNTDGSARTEIRMGVELNEWKEPVAYWMRQPMAGDWTWSMTAGTGNNGQGNYARIPAEQMLHIFMRERVNQTRGVPWASSIIVRTEMLDGYAEAEVTSARAEACKGMIYYSDFPTDGVGLGDVDPLSGAVIQTMEPGGSIIAPFGSKVDSYNPTHPNGNFGMFRKDMLRDIATGLCQLYNSLAGDYESVNYSSLRGAKLNENESWMLIQRFFIDAFHEEIFENWLEMALMSQRVSLPLAKFDKFNSPEWTGRRWPWVDPEKEVAAKESLLRNGFSTRTKILAESGLDFEEVLDQLKQEEKLIAEAGLGPLLLQNVGAKPQQGPPAGQS